MTDQPAGVVLPELPEPYSWTGHFNHSGTFDGRAFVFEATDDQRVFLFTANQMRAYATAAVLEERDRLTEILRSLLNETALKQLEAAIRQQGEE